MECAKNMIAFSIPGYIEENQQMKTRFVFRAFLNSSYPVDRSAWHQFDDSKSDKTHQNEWTPRDVTVLRRKTTQTNKDGVWEKVHTHYICKQKTERFSVDRHTWKHALYVISVNGIRDCNFVEMILALSLRQHTKLQLHVMGYSRQVANWIQYYVIDSEIYSPTPLKWKQWRV